MVIASGIGGLSCAGLLASSGRTASVLEMRSDIGDTRTSSNLGNHWHAQMIPRSRRARGPFQASADRRSPLKSRLERRLACGSIDVTLLN